jgi:hypothetical protein
MNVECRARRLLRWYPKSWRETHDEEFLALLEDSICEQPFSPSRSLNVVTNALRLRSVELRLTHRRLLLTSSAPLVVLVAVIGLATNGFGLASASGPTKGGMPPGYGPNFAYSKIPDYLAVSIGSNRTGYIPKAYIVSPSGYSRNPLDGGIAPIYASDLTTLLGHLYPGVGYVRLGTSPWSLPCVGEGTGTISVHGTRTMIPLPCPSTMIVLPNVVGIYTPTAVGKLSSLGVGVVVDNVHSSSVPPGHIVSISPRSGTTVHARQLVIVDNSVQS